MATIASSISVPIVGCGAAAWKCGPAGLLGHPEDAVGAVLVGVLGVGAVGAVGLELGVLRLEGVGDVLQEDQAEDDVLVLGGVHVVAESVGGLPELRLEAEIGAGIALRSRAPSHGPSPCLIGCSPSVATRSSAAPRTSVA